MNWVEQLVQVRWALSALALACLVAYVHTLDVPMYLDDISSISDNPAIHVFTDWPAIFQFSEMRFVGYLSFAANYSMHGDHVAGYHITNTLIHLGVGVALYLLLRVLARSPVMAGAAGAERLPLAAFCVALVFLLHPLHTQAVTYIVQRLASMVALFYLLSMLCYAWARTQDTKTAITGYVASIMFAMLALFTKQNAVTLPAALLLMEYVFFATDIQSRRRVLVVAVAGGLGLVLCLVALHISGSLTFEQLDQLTRETSRVSRPDYLASQMLVLWRYLGLAVWPNPLVLDYGLQPTWSWGDWQVWLAAVMHLSVISAALLMVRKLPLISFGLLFFYLAHVVESGVIPIKDLMFEHRAYLPDIGLCLALAGVLLFLRQKVVIASVLALSFVLLVLTWQRNNLWRDQVAFYNHAIEHAPDQPRNWVFLSKVYHKAGENAQALTFLEKELRANEERYGKLRVDYATLLYQAKLLRLNGRDEEASKLEQQLARSPMSRVQHMRLFLQQGNAALRAGDYDAAEQAYRNILSMDPNQSSAKVNLGVIALQRKQYEEAIRIFESMPNHPVARENLPVARAAMAGEVELGGLKERVIEKAQ